MSIIQKWNGTKIHIREDRYVNATDMAKATEKDLSEFQKLDWVQEYLQIFIRKM